MKVSSCLYASQPSVVASKPSFKIWCICPQESSVTLAALNFLLVAIVLGFPFFVKSTWDFYVKMHPFHPSDRTLGTQVSVFARHLVPTLILLAQKTSDMALFFVCRAILAHILRAVALFHAWSAGLVSFFWHFFNPKAPCSFPVTDSGSMLNDGKLRSFSTLSKMSFPFRTSFLRLRKCFKWVWLDGKRPRNIMSIKGMSEHKPPQKRDLGSRIAKMNLRIK